MAKRFTATEKWDDKWFRSLPPHYKLLWMYILDRCDNAGFWEADMGLASYYVGKRFSEGEALKMFEGRVFEVNGSKWFVPKFIAFQYGELNDESKPHLSVIEKLKRYGVYDDFLSNKFKELGKGSVTLKDKEKDKEKDKDKAKDKYGESVFLTAEQKEKLVAQLGEARFGRVVQILDNYKTAVGKKYKSDYHAILNWVIGELEKREQSGKAPKKQPIWKCTACGQEMPENEKYNHWNEGVCPKFHAASPEFVKKIREEIAESILHGKS